MSSLELRGSNHQGLSDEPFTYQALHSLSSFRLLKVLAVDSEDRIQCILEDYELDDAPEYAALSYCWGSLPHRETCFVNGYDMQITRSLSSALQQIHRSGRSSERYVWADALCINQDNVNEKDAQIKLMPQIYAKASKVIAWLSGGPSEQKALENVQRFIDSGWHFPKDKDAAYTTYLVLMRAFVSLSQLDYWRRMWIVQEVCLARDIELTALSARVLWKPFFKALASHIGNAANKYWYMQSKLHEYMSTTTMHIAELDTLRGRISRNEPMPLLQALYWTRKCEASLVKDKIFALLGLVTDSWHPLQKLHYGDNLEDIEQEITFTEMTDMAPSAAVFGSPYRLDVITFMSFAGYAQVVGLPRWCPSWTDRGLWTRLRRWQLLRLDWVPVGFKATPCLVERPQKTATGALVLRGHSLGGIGNLSSRNNVFAYQKPGILLAATKSVLDELDSSDRKTVIDWQSKLTNSASESIRPWKAEVERYRRRLGQMVEYLSRIADQQQEQALGRDDGTAADPEDQAIFVECQDQLRGILLLGSSLDDSSSNWNFRRMHFFRTSQGFIGFGLFHGVPGDVVYLVEGFSTPVILRRYGSTLSSRGFVLVGEMLTLGVMRGEYFANHESRALLKADLPRSEKDEIHLF